MPRLLVFLFLTTAAFTFSCSTAKYAGNYDFIIEDTPMGDYTGKMLLMKDGKEYSGKLISSNGGESELRDLKIEGDMVSFGTSAEGYYARISGKFVGEEFIGMVNVEGMEFPMKAKLVSKK